MPRLPFSVLAAMLALLAAPAFAQPASLSIDGHVAHAGPLTLEQLKALPPATVALTFQTDHGAITGSWTGALLLDIVKGAGPIDSGNDKSAPLQHTILARGRDGYGVALAIGRSIRALPAKR